MSMTTDFEPVEGVDVSRYQGPDPIDWKQLYLSDRQVVYIQTCRGVDSPDPMAAVNLRGAVHAGLIPGLYQRVFPQLGSPEKHALHFLACLNVLNDDLPEIMLPFAVDYEEEIPDGDAWCMEYIEVIRKATGQRRHMIYSSGSYFEPTGYIGQDAWQDDPDIYLWVAHTDRWAQPGFAPGNPKFKHPRAVLHQYKQNGTIPGIAPGRALLDVSMRSLPLIGR